MYTKFYSNFSYQMPLCKCSSKNWNWKNEDATGEFFSKHNMDVELNQSDCFKMMSFIKTANQIALKVQHPLCLHKNLPLCTSIKFWLIHFEIP